MVNETPVDSPDEHLDFIWHRHESKHHQHSVSRTQKSDQAFYWLGSRTGCIFGADGKNKPVAQAVIMT